MADDNADLLAELASGPLYRFADWPNPDVPNWRAGVYTVWDDRGSLIYVGMGGRGLLQDAHLSAPLGSSKLRGVRDRLRSHWSGRRSGDQFCSYVFDRLVLPTLTQQQLAEAAAGTLQLDTVTRDFVRTHLGYRFVVASDGSSALSVEAQVRKGALDGRKPFLNPL